MSLRKSTSLSAAKGVKKTQTNSKAPAVEVEGHKVKIGCCDSLWNLGHVMLWELFYIPFWQTLFTGLTLLHTAVMKWCPEYLQDFVFALPAVYYVLGATIYARYALFELWWGSTPYITPRETGTDLHNTSADGYYHWAWIIMGTFMFSYLKMDLETFYILKPIDYLKLLALFISTDNMFFLYHRFGHSKFYFMYHRIHHKCTAPTACVNVDLFHTLDATGHIICYLIGAQIIYQFVDISDEVWMAGLLQWFVVGQLQHGGKSILGAAGVGGVEPLRQMFGFTTPMPVLHDIHHTSNKFCNFGLIGHCDYLAGCYHN